MSRRAGGAGGLLFPAGSVAPQCHASTLARTPHGWVAAWFAGTREGAEDMAIWLCRDTGSGWSAPERRFKVAPAAHWNPVLFLDDTGRLHLWFKVGADCAGWRSWHAVSHDGGASWTRPAPFLPKDSLARGPVRCQPIILADGTWLAGGSDERLPGPDGRTWWAFVDRSGNRGRTWRVARIGLEAHAPEGLGAIQPTLWASPSGVHAFFRTGLGRIFRSDSADGGRTWSAAYATALPNNNSSIAAARLRDGTLALVWNPTSGSWGTPRTPLRLSLSPDDGATWDRHLDLACGPGEYSYPAVLAHGAQLAVTWTHARSSIAWWRGPASAVPAGAVLTATPAPEPHPSYENTTQATVTPERHRSPHRHAPARTRPARRARTRAAG